MTRTVWYVAAIALTVLAAYLTARFLAEWFNLIERSL